MSPPFDYFTAFSRNIGWVTREEQAALRDKRVAVAGMGGVGGSHLITLARLGVGHFNIADLDDFDLPNFNRQYGAGMSTLGQPKLDVMARTVQDINPEIGIRHFDRGVDEANLEDFLTGVDLYMDSLDIFALDIRRQVFQRCYELGIPTLTAAPMGMGTAMLIFVPGKMSFEEYFCLDDVPVFEDKIIKFVIGVSPSVQQRHYLVDRSSVNFLQQKVPSTAMGIELAAGVAGSNALKLLLHRGPVIHAPHGLHFDAYRNRLIRTWRPFGNRHPLQRLMFWYVKRLLRQ
ncbi:ThiF family adenylyltransferase [Thiohalophilus thiocyanatoxydans]|uniref:Molybdopterin/thiamine biosynthesis adenylyltransferase n=1 Tax=Thiohalophilus thiocyanatoxydans TaxID=381308 RepID=A0A4R8IT38_9GAMM|nr:ThiF family adenylyltransferase [Thiohalophilus thiocyanatoxydans]TDY03788.1 molybdopterin/thiamine biosynthesis adenylyltransferase [Thiohalophilus thiocyanatoxydans]